MLQQNRAKDNFKVLMPIKVTQETPPDLSLKSGFMVKAEGCLKFKSCPKEGLIYTYALIESDSTYAMPSCGAQFCDTEKQFYFFDFKCLSHSTYWLMCKGFEFLSVWEAYYSLPCQSNFNFCSEDFHLSFT